MITFAKRYYKKFIAFLISGSIILSAPGLPCWQILAQQTGNAQGSASSSQGTGWGISTQYRGQGGTTSSLGAGQVLPLFLDVNMPLAPTHSAQLNFVPVIGDTHSGTKPAVGKQSAAPSYPLPYRLPVDKQGSRREEWKKNSTLPRSRRFRQPRGELDRDRRRTAEAADGRSGAGPAHAGAALDKHIPPGIENSASLDKTSAPKSGEDDRESAAADFNRLTGEKDIPAVSAALRIFQAVESAAEQKFQRLLPLHAGGREVKGYLPAPGQTASDPDTASAIPPMPPASPTPPQNGSGNIHQNPPHSEGPLISVTENIFGFRSVHGERGAPLPEMTQSKKESERILGGILGLFKKARKSKILEEAENLKSTFQGEAAISNWRALHDRVHRINKDNRNQYDSKKDEDGALKEAWGRLRVMFGSKKPITEASFRHLSPRKYDSGLKGVLQRIWQPNIKYKTGWWGIVERIALSPRGFLAVWWDLFDMFFYGFYRRSIGYELSGRHEDFLGDKAEEYIIAEMHHVAAHLKYSERKRTSDKYRPFIESLPGRLVWAVAEATVQFTTRRVVTAVFSAVALGVMAHFALPGLAVAGVMGASSVSVGASAVHASWLGASPVNVSYIGPALVWISEHAVKLVAATLGRHASALLADTFGVFLNDLKFGAMLNTSFLSMLLALPQAHEQRMREINGPDKPIAGWLTTQGIVERTQTVFCFWDHPVFWKKSWSIFKGMMLVGAEIHLAIGFSHGLDLGLNHVLTVLTRHNFNLHPFYSVGSFVDGDPSNPDLAKRKTGAISWGSILIDKAQHALHFNLSDTVFHALNSMSGAPSNDSALWTLLAGHGPSPDGGGIAGAVFHGVVPQQEHKDGEGIKVRNVGEWNKEMAQAQERLKVLDSRLADTRRDLADMEKQSRPLTRDELAAHDRASKDLENRRGENYLESKLAQMHDIKHHKLDDAAELERLKKLWTENQDYLPLPGENPGRKDSLLVGPAMKKAAQDAVEWALGRRGEEAAVGTNKDLDRQKIQTIREKLAALETLNAQGNGDTAIYQSMATLLSIKAGDLNKELWPLKSGRLMMDIHRDQAKTKTLSDTDFALFGIIPKVEAQIKPAIALIDKKIQGIKQTEQVNQQALAQAKENQQKVAQWTADAKNTLTQDQKQQGDMNTFHSEAQSAADDIGFFAQDMKALLSQIDREDGNGGSALDKYNQDKASLPTVIGWRTHGKQGDPNYKNLDKYLHDRDDDRKKGDPKDGAKAQLAKLDEGLARLRKSQGKEAIGVAIALIPGPDMGFANFSGHGVDEILGKLDDRRAYWQDQLNTYQSEFKELNSRLDSTNSATEKDDFGREQYVSLPYWIAKNKEKIDGYHKELQDKISGTQGSSGPQGINALVDSINKATGAGLPPLTLPGTDGLGLQAFEDALKAYPKLLDNATFPNQDTFDIFQAKLNKALLGDAIARAGRTTILWAKADGENTTLAKIESKYLMPIQPLLHAIVGDPGWDPKGPDPSKIQGAIPEMIADIDPDIAFMHLSDADKIRGEADLKARKFKLLEDIRPAIDGAVKALDLLIALQTEQIDSLKTAPKLGDIPKLLDAEIDFYKSIQDASGPKLAWALASNGAKDKDAADADVRIKAEVKKYQDILHTPKDHPDQKGLVETKQELKDRIAPEGTLPPTRTEPESPDGQNYGEKPAQPFNLNDKIKRYSDEMNQRADEFGIQAAQLNKILTDINKLTAANHDPYNFVALRTKIGTTDDDVKYMQGLADKNTLTDLGNTLRQIVAKYGKAGGAPALPNPGNAASPPTGPQDPLKLNNAQQIADLADQAANRLVPGPLQTPKDAAVSFAVARYLFAHGIVDSSNKNIVRIKTIALPALDRIIPKINDAIADLTTNSGGNDTNYVNGNSLGETSDHVVNRKIAIFKELADATADAANLLDQKIGWDRDGIANTIPQIGKYYNGLSDIYQNSVTVADKELGTPQDPGPFQQMKDALQKTYDDLEAYRKKLEGWHAQLGDKRGSALRQLADDFGSAGDVFKRILEKNIDYNRVNEQFKRAAENLKWEVGRAEEKQREIEELVNSLSDPDSLDQKLAEKIETLAAQNGVWMLGGDAAGSAHAAVVHKADLPVFLDKLFSLFQKQYGQDFSALESRVLADPRSLADILPHSGVADFSNDPDGFYLFYDTEFSVPHGFASAHQITAGNFAHFLHSDWSLTGYEFFNPSNLQSAASGDRGIEVKVLSREGKNWINYLDIDLHRFAQDAPPDLSIAATAGESRLFVFDHYALMLLDGKVYFAGTGFGDWALANRDQSLAYYGGAAQTSVKFTELVQLSVKQEGLFIRDPRWFEMNFNLDFTHFDPTLDQTFHIRADAKDKSYNSTSIGPSIDVAKWLHSNNQFTVDLYWARQSGSDDYSQQAGGISVLNGFAIKGKDGSPLAKITNKATIEGGTKYNTLGDRFSAELPKGGIVFSAEGRYYGDANTYYLQLEKKLPGEHTAMSLGFGKRLVGERQRLFLGINNQYTLGEMWRGIMRHAKTEMTGGKPLEGFNHAMDDFFKAEIQSKAPSAPAVAALKDAVLHDIGVKLLRERIGSGAEEIDSLRKAGKVLSNARVRNMVGFASNPTNNPLIDRALAGNVKADTVSDFTIAREKKARIERDVRDLYRDGLELQARIPQIAKELFPLIVEIAAAEREGALAQAEAREAPSVIGRQEGKVRLAEAQARLDEARIRYNTLTGNPADAGLPEAFTQLNAKNLDALITELKQRLAVPERLTEILRHLNPAELESALGPEAVDWLNRVPLIDHMTLMLGTQLPDQLADQQFGDAVKVEIQLPIPGWKTEDRVYVLQEASAIKEMDQMRRDHALAARKEALSAEFWSAASRTLRPAAERAAENFRWTTAGYRGGHVSEARWREARAERRWADETALESETQGALAGAWRAMDASLARDAKFHSGGPIRSLDDGLREAFDEDNQPKLLELAFRETEAAEMARVNGRRIQRAAVDISVGTNLTESGLSWLPNLAVTGAGVTPLAVFDHSSRELARLEKEKGGAKTEMYRLLAEKTRINLAVQFFQNAAAFIKTQEAEAHMDREVLPDLGLRLARAQAGGDPSQIARAQSALEKAQFARDGIESAHGQASATINYLLGRSPEAPVELGFTLNDALNRLGAMLSEKGHDPVTIERRIREKNLEEARAEEAEADKDLKVQRTRTDPTSPIVKTAGQVIQMFSQRRPGDPQKVAAAHIRTLQAQRALEAFDAELPIQRVRAQDELKAVYGTMNRLRGDTDPRNRLEYVRLGRNAYELEAELALLKEPGVQSLDSSLRGNDKLASIPSSYAELKEKIASAYERTAAHPDSFLATDLSPLNAGEQGFDEEDSPGSRGHMRYFHYHEGLDRVLDGKGFWEKWTTVTFGNLGGSAGADALYRQAERRTAREDLLRGLSAAEARGQGNAKIVQFAADVRSLRKLDGPDSVTPAQAGVQDLDSRFRGNDKSAEFRNNLLQRLQAERDEIAALLNLPSDTPIDALAHLVPENAEGARENFRSIADRTIAEIKDRRLESIRHQLAMPGFQRDFGIQNDLMNRLQVETIARRYGYKGFTLEGVWGTFHGKSVFGPVLDFPDPRDIRTRLERILPKEMVQRLVEDGEMERGVKEVQLRMQTVRDSVNVVEQRRDLVPVAENHYRAVAEQFVRGKVGYEDFLAAQDALSDAWTQLSRGVAELQGNFATLVMELEAIGMETQGGGRNFSPHDAVMGRKQSRADPMERILRYASRRMGEPDGPDFASKLDAVLSAQGLEDAKLRADIAEKADLYHRMVEDADAVRNGDLSAPEKLDYLVRADPEGLRQEIQELLGRLSATTAWPQVLELLNRDLGSETDSASQIGKSQAIRRAQERDGADLHDAWWHAVKAPPAVEGAYVRLKALYGKMLEARQVLLESFVRDSKGPTEFVLEDIALDNYLKTQQAFDDEIVKTFELDEVRTNPVMASGLTGLYNLGAVLSRQMDWVKNGRGMAAIDALIMLQESRLAASYHDFESREIQEEAALELARLKDIRERWTSRPEGLSPLYAVTQIDEQGRRLWTIDGWHTQKDIDDFKAKGKIIEQNGRTYLKSDEGKKLEILSGVDLAEFNRDSAKDALEQNDRERRLFETWKDSDFALAGMDGGVQEGWSYDDLMRQRLQGRVFFFDADVPNIQDTFVWDVPNKRSSDVRDVDASKLHPAVHPLAAFQKKNSPKESAFHLPEMIVYDGKKNISREQFPTRESLEDYVRVLQSSGRKEDQEEAAHFHLLQPGEKGIQAMIAAAGKHRDEHLRKGWMSVKLGSYGFAVDPDGVPKPYLTKDGFEKALQSMREAPQKSARAQRALETAEMELKSAQGTEPANQAFHEAQEKIKTRLGPEVRKDLKRNEGEIEADYSQRVETEIAMRLVKDPEYLKTQKAFNDRIRPFMKKGETLEVLQHRVDIAKKDVHDAEAASQRSRAGSGQWRLFETRDLALKLDADKNIVEVSARPAFGDSRLDEKIGAPENISRGQLSSPPETSSGDSSPRMASPRADGVSEGEAHGAVTMLDGTVYAVIPDGSGRAVRVLRTEAEVEREAEHWSPIGVDGQPAIHDEKGNPLPQGRGNIRVSPSFRPLYFVDTQTVDPQTRQPLPVLLNLHFLMEQKARAKKDLRGAKYSGLGLQNWGNLLLAIPRGAVENALSPLTGEDPRWTGFQGEVRARKTYASVEKHRGPARRLADHVFSMQHPEPFRDPGVGRNIITKPLKPWRNLIDKPAKIKTQGGEYDVNFGADAAERALQEDEENIRLVEDRIQTLFEGDVENIWIETRLGRAADEHGKALTYETSSIAEGEKDLHGKLVHGSDAIGTALLKEPEVFNNDSDDEAKGETGGVPGHLEVGRVVKRIHVKSGARQDSLAQKNLINYAENYSSTLKTRRENAFKNTDDLDRQANDAEKKYQERLRRRGDVSAGTQSAFESAYPIFLRKAVQEGIEKRIAADKEEIQELQRAVAQEQAHISDLQERIRKAGGGTNGNSPGDGNQKPAANDHPAESHWWNPLRWFQWFRLLFHR